MYLLDTNHCSRVIQGEATLLSQLQQKRAAGVAISVITHGELIFMAQNSQRKANNLEQVNTFLQLISLYPINAAIANQYGDLKARLFDQFAPKERAKRRSTKLQELEFDDNDLWIAATALQYNLTLVSADSDFQRIAQVQNLSLENWLSSP